MEIILNENKIKAYDLNNKLITYNNINFYGFPYISYINGHFNYELDLADMNELFNNVLNVLNTSYVDVLAFHSPIYGILDLEFNTNYGSSIIFDKLKYSLDNDKIPIFYLHGHVHHYHGFDRLNIGNNILLPVYSTFNSLFKHSIVTEKHYSNLSCMNIHWLFN